ncbi:MAG: hypothetical protein HZB39_01685 [Planctomycetes bacterium]|nr:hypothetical protein [Planctomycetota bacterium]
MLDLLRLLFELILDVVFDTFVALRVALEQALATLVGIYAEAFGGVIEAVLTYATLLLASAGLLGVVSAWLIVKWIVWSIRSPGSSGPVTTVAA